MANDATCPYVLRIPLARGKFMRYRCSLDAPHSGEQHVVEIPGASTQRQLSDGWAETDGPTRLYWSAPM